MKDTNWYAGGGHARDIVMNDETIRDAVNNWLSDPTKLKTPYRLEIRKLYDLENLKTPIANEAYEYDIKSRDWLLRDVEELLNNSKLDSKEIEKITTELLIRHQDLERDPEKLKSFRSSEELDELAEESIAKSRIYPGIMALR